LVWLGRKDSNLRMPESKSGALTSLATPQLLVATLSVSVVVEWVLIQTLGEESRV
jgi:hypothetical protein